MLGNYTNTSEFLVIGTKCSDFVGIILFLIKNFLDEKLRLPTCDDDV